MLKILLKKQLMEVFRSYFYNAKKNKKRSKGGTIACFIFFAFLIILVLGGLSTGISYMLCEPFESAGMSWLYFIIMSGFSLLMGTFGSVFNTFQGLYLSKDNDLLLSMPVPIRDIIISRLLNVYLMGTVYSGMIFLPALIVYWVISGINAAKVSCGILMLLLITLIVLMLSCLLGWCVAKISQKLKNKSFITVLASLIFIGIYYFFYFKAQSLLQDLIANVAVYGAELKDSAYGLYLFGRIGEGSLINALGFWGACLVLLLGTWLLLKRTFLSIATSAGVSSKVRVKSKTIRAKSLFGTLLSKEFIRFTSSANYMLNCGLGILFIPAIGVLLLFKGSFVFDLLDEMFGVTSGVTPILICTILCALSSLNNIVAPSVSLEGKNLWILQSSPIEPRLVLRAKTILHLILTLIPMLFSVGCTAVIMNGSWALKLLTVLLPLVYTVFITVFGSFFGLKMSNLTWTNELYPIKQGGAIAVALFGGWGFCGIFAALFFLLRKTVGIIPYLAIWTGIYAIAAVILQRWMDTKGAARFSVL